MVGDQRQEAWINRRAEWWVKRRLDESSENHCPGSYNRLEFYVYLLDFILKAHEALASTSPTRRQLVFFHHGNPNHDRDVRTLGYHQNGVHRSSLAYPWARI
ncbi:hypothetical protein ARMSODRAFT_356719 [Armillaria solidipes]|uniref:Uncharacterized protein n=1 Tax=Armillaria solidipes TaxID=1076256 RepID=A0A2H3B5Y6_9AGAR|nr:hypothetical protein ARMSODRAFT_356719 [Armillaria solidipes]